MFSCPVADGISYLPCYNPGTFQSYRPGLHRFNAPKLEVVFTVRLIVFVHVLPYDNDVLHIHTQHALLLV